jgi:hypothetical protein
MTQTWALLACTIGPPLIALASTALRLRWQARRDQRRQHTLRALTEHLPHKGAVEIHDVRDDGSRLLIRITPPPPASTGES